MTTIVLLAIISVGVSSRWFGADAFRINSLAAEYVVYARLAQRIAMANSDVDIHLNLIQVSGDWQFAVIEDEASVLTTLHQVQIDAANIDIQATAGIGQSALSTSTGLDIKFDGLGNISEVLIGSTQAQIAAGIAVEMTGTISQLLCISPLGFAHAGTCV